MAAGMLCCCRRSRPGGTRVENRGRLHQLVHGTNIMTLSKLRVRSFENLPKSSWGKGGGGGVYAVMPFPYP